MAESKMHQVGKKIEKETLRLLDSWCEICVQN